MVSASTSSLSAPGQKLMECCRSAHSPDKEDPMRFVPTHSFRFLGPYCLAQNQKNAVTSQLQTNPHRPAWDHWSKAAPKRLLSRRRSRRIQKICERLQERRQRRSHTYQLYKGKSAITVSNKKHVLCSWLGNKMVPNINCVFFRRSIILQKEMTFATITF